jgi:hypothetical protein
MNPLRRLRAWGNKTNTAKNKWIVPPYVLVALAFLLGLWTIDQQNSADLEQNSRSDALTSYTDCVRRVETRDDLRGVLFAILNVAAKPDGIMRVTSVINEKYPALSLDECGDVPA